MITEATKLLIKAIIANNRDDCLNIINKLPPLQAAHATLDAFRLISEMDKHSHKAIPFANLLASFAE